MSSGSATSGRGAGVEVLSRVVDQVDSWGSPRPRPGVTTAEPANGEAARLFGNGGDAVVLAGAGPTGARRRRPEHVPGSSSRRPQGDVARGRIAALVELIGQ